MKHHVLAALAHGRHVVIGTSGLSAEDYAKIDVAARQAERGVLAAGNFSITATLLRRFALEAARYVPDVEVIDYASPRSPTPLRHRAGARRAPVGGPDEGDVEAGGGARRPARDARRGGRRQGAVQVHSVRMPSFVLSCEAIFGAPDERLVIRHDAGSSAQPYVAGTLLAARKVSGFTGLKRGLDHVLG